MKYKKILLGAVSKASYQDKGEVKFKIPGEISDKKAYQVLSILKKLLAVDSKVLTHSLHFYNDESFTLFTVNYKKVELDEVFDALQEVTNLAIDLNNMYGSTENDDKIKSALRLTNLETI